MKVTEEAVHTANIAWKGMSVEVRGVLIRWLALEHKMRELFCRIVCRDGNCPRDRDERD